MTPKAFTEGQGAVKDMGFASTIHTAGASIALVIAWAAIVVATLIVLVKDLVCNPIRFWSMRSPRAHEMPQIPGMESIYVQTSRVRLHALRNINHDPRSPLILFLHGFPENSFSWRYQLAHFQETHTVVALDMRGFGSSDAPTGAQNYSMDLLCLDVCAVVRACGFETCVLVGHDWGGMVAWNVAANFPRMVTGLITLCSPHPRAYNEPACFTPSQARRSSYFLLFATPLLPEIFLAHSEGQKILRMMLAAPMGIITKDAIARDIVRCYVDALLRPGRLTAGLNYYRSSIFLRDERAEKFVEKALSGKGLHTPTMQLYADSDGAFECAMFEECSIASDVTLQKLENCSHWAQQECPRQVNECLERFIVSIDLSTTTSA